jgi:hypothetical protein
MLLVGLTAPSLGATLPRASDKCDPAHRHCVDAVVAACCCQPVPASTVAVSPFVTAWSAANKALWHVMVWTADTARELDVDRPVGLLFDAAGRSNRPASPLSSSEASTVLLI